MIKHINNIITLYSPLKEHEMSFFEMIILKLEKNIDKHTYEKMVQLVLNVYIKIFNRNYDADKINKLYNNKCKIEFHG